MKKRIITIFLLSILPLAHATAGTYSPRIDKIQNNQKGRITQGIKSGQLTGKEAWRLGKQQKNIYKKERRFKSDGQFTRRERAIIHRDLARSSKSIYVQKHDRQMRASNRGAGIKSPGINKRQNRQEKRIKQGVRSGALTAREMIQLGREQARIYRQERRFKSDGRFTKRERARVHKSQNRASRNIYRKKHNNKYR